ENWQRPMQVGDLSAQRVLHVLPDGLAVEVAVHYLGLTLAVHDHERRRGRDAYRGHDACVAGEVLDAVVEERDLALAARNRVQRSLNVAVVEQTRLAQEALD